MTKKEAIKNIISLSKAHVYYARLGCIIVF